MLALALVASLLPFPMPWDGPPPPPEKSQLVLERPGPPDPFPKGSIMEVPALRQLPEHWRTSEDRTPKARSNAGLSGLQASGSAQFCREEFYAVLGALRGRKVTVVDLRQEPHTLLNGASIAWGPVDVIGADRSASEVERVERRWTQLLAERKFVTVTAETPGPLADEKTWNPLTLKLDIREALTEPDLLVRSHWGSFRIAAPDTFVPRDRDVDRFVHFVSELDDDVWLHLHCDTGENRTTLFLTLLDMMRNYFRVSRPDIIERQRMLGGIDLLAGPGRAGREAFLEAFYSYCWQEGPEFGTSWTTWKRRQPKDQSADREVAGASDSLRP